MRRSSNQPYEFNHEGMAGRLSEHMMAQEGYPIDPSFRQHVEHANMYAPESNTAPGLATNHTHVSTRPTFHQHHSFDGRGSQEYDHANGDHAVEDGAAKDGRQKKGSSSSIANDIELRKLFNENSHRSLRDVADQVLLNERGPKSEKTKQIFAMIW